MLQHSKLATGNSLTQHMSPKPWQRRPEPVLWPMYPWLPELQRPINSCGKSRPSYTFLWKWHSMQTETHLMCGHIGKSHVEVKLLPLLKEEEVQATPMQWAWLSFRNLLPTTWLLRFEKKVLQLLLGVGMFLRLAGPPKLLTGAPNLGDPSKITHLNLSKVYSCYSC